MKIFIAMPPTTANACTALALTPSGTYALISVQAHTTINRYSSALAA